MYSDRNKTVILYIIIFLPMLTGNKNIIIRRTRLKMYKNVPVALSRSTAENVQKTFIVAAVCAVFTYIRVFTNPTCRTIGGFWYTVRVVRKIQ